MAGAQASASWLTPQRLFAGFCVINLINYLDCGTIASNGVNGRQGSCSESGICSSGSGIQGEFDLNNFEDGVISSAFLVGLLVSSPIFASLASSINPLRLVGVGLSIWTVAVAFCGFSFNFWSIAISRMLVGIGEASFVSLAAPFIDDNAPINQRAAWLGAFYMCIPSGYAVGYVFGGLIGQVGWRWAFFLEALLMLPFAIIGLLMKPLTSRGFVPIVLESTVDMDLSINQASEELPEPSRPADMMIMLKDIKVILLDRVYLVNLFGNICYNFVLGAYSYWGPKAGYNIYRLVDADYVFGGVTVVCGVFGTLAGGLVLDRMESTVPNAFKLLSGAAFFGAIFCFSSFCFESLYIFLALFAIGELLIFATQAPVNFICLHCVKPSLRPLSMALSTIFTHVLGDVPSSPLVGLLQDHINNWRTTTLILTSVLFITAAIWCIGVFLHPAGRPNEEDTETAVKSSLSPLLEE